MRRISFDTETTGLDLRHGAKPFFVTVCSLDGEGSGWWEWEVDPLTRNVRVPRSELDEILDLIEASDQIVLHNAKFDATAIQSIAPGFQWPWHKTVDTLVAAHLLGSNQPKDLGSLSLRWLKQDISRYEKSIVKAANEARSLARREHKDFLIAKEGLSCMPSAKTEVSRMDYWLPRALAGHLMHEESHPWWTVLRDYANVDSAVTARLWPVMEAEIKRRGQWKIFEAQNELTESIIEMENRGVTMSMEGVERRKSSRQRESELQGRRCRNIARMKGHDLELPKAGVNDSMRHFVFEVLKLEGVANRKAKTDKPTLNSAALEKYAKEADPRSLEKTFFASLLAKRDADTEVQFLEAYTRFMLPTETPGWGRLHPNFNGTGTDTLRFSSSNPNSQNCKKPDEDDSDSGSIRSCFGPAPGREWWSCDAKNIELRIPAYASGEKDQIELFERPNDPPFYGSVHLLNFSVVYPDLWSNAVEEVGIEKAGPHCKKKYASTWYQWCKNGNFAIQYSAGKRTADSSYRRDGSFDKLKVKFAKLETLNQRCVRDAKTKGVVETLPDRSVDPERGYPLLTGRTENGGVLTTTPLNYFSSGSAMWWMRRAMVRVHSILKRWKSEEAFDGFIAIQVHDELVLDFPYSLNKGNRWRLRIIQDLMEQGGTDIGVPVPVSCTYHPVHWGEGETL